MPFENKRFDDTILSTVEPPSSFDWAFTSGAVAASASSEPTSHTSGLTQRMQDAFKTPDPTLKTQCALQTPDPTPEQLDTLQSRRPNSHIRVVEKPSPRAHNATANLDAFKAFEYLNTPCGVPSTQLAFGNVFKGRAETPTPGQQRQQPELRGQKAREGPFWRGMGVNDHRRRVWSRGHRKGIEVIYVFCLCLVYVSFISRSSLVHLSFISRLYREGGSPWPASSHQIHHVFIVFITNFSIQGDSKGESDSCS